MNSSVISVQAMKMRPEVRRRTQMASFIFLRKKSIMVAMPILAPTETKLMTTPRKLANVSETLTEMFADVRLITIELCHIWTRP